MVVEPTGPILDMLPRLHRLRTPAAITAVLRRGVCATNDYARLCLLKQASNQPVRVACVVGKKVHQLAVKRHQYQRYLRVWARTVLPQVPSSDLVIVGQPALATLSGLDEVTKKLYPLLQKVIS